MKYPCLDVDLSRALVNITNKILADEASKGFVRLVHVDPKRLTVVTEECCYDSYNECMQFRKVVYFLQQVMGLNGRLRNMYEVKSAKSYY